MTTEPPEIVARMCEIIEKACEAIEHRAARNAGVTSSADLLEGVVDGLIVAYEYAKLDQDPLTVALIEGALMRVGRRLAQGAGPKDAGLVCH